MNILNVATVFLSVFIACVLGRSVDVRSAAGSSEWGYKNGRGVLGPNNWYKSYKFCAGKRQSPIDIVNPRKIQVKSSLYFGGFNDIVGSLVNNGHSATFNVDKSQGTMTLLKGRFQLEQFHVHFGCSDDIGSEHTVSGMSYPAEVHLVFFNSKYETIKEAQDKRDGLLVVGAFLEIDGFRERSYNSELNKITSQLEGIIKPGSSIPIKQPIDLTKLIPPIEDDDDITVYMYSGSLTTPPCYQSVKWIVLKETVAISSDQLKMFRMLESNHGPMCNNFRPVQPSNRKAMEIMFSAP